MESRLHLDISSQPSDTACGPTCLHAVYQYYGDDVELAQLIREVPVVEGGGTLAVLLGSHALRRGYRARIYTYNLQVFDPTWFTPGGVDLADKLRQRHAARKETKLRTALRAYIDYVEQGGTVLMEDLTAALIRKHLKRETPMLTGLSSTYLYRAPREFGPNDDDDDVRGDPAGHFVVLCGYHQDHRTVLVADPYQPNPLSSESQYAAPIDRVIGAVLLGVLTYDANLLVIEPRSGVK